jgi:hypothetical protein
MDHKGLIMLRHVLISAALVASSMPALPVAASATIFQPSTVGSRDCQPTPARSTRRSILGGIGGAIAGRVLGSNSVTRTLGSFVPAQTMLTDALLNLLDCGEQQKAVQATEQATQQAETRGAGATVAWRSESRPGVSGTSTVTAVDTPSAGGSSGRRCMTVTDVVIIDGEETSMPKRMCRVPPSARYARV